jgi:hypothetical protein
LQLVGEGAHARALEARAQQPQRREPRGGVEILGDEAELVLVLPLTGAGAGGLSAGIAASGAAWGTETSSLSSVVRGTGSWPARTAARPGEVSTFSPLAKPSLPDGATGIGNAPLALAWRSATPVASTRLSSSAAWRRTSSSAARDGRASRMSRGSVAAV